MSIQKIGSPEKIDTIGNNLELLKQGVQTIIEGLAKTGEVKKEEVEEVK